jgi:hypothetical protein
VTETIKVGSGIKSIPKIIVGLTGGCQTGLWRKVITPQIDVYKHRCSLSGQQNSAEETDRKPLAQIAVVAFIASHEAPRGFVKVIQDRSRTVKIGG